MTVCLHADKSGNSSCFGWGLICLCIQLILHISGKLTNRKHSLHCGDLRLISCKNMLNTTLVVFSLGLPSLNTYIQYESECMLLFWRKQIFPHRDLLCFAAIWRMEAHWKFNEKKSVISHKIVHTHANPNPFKHYAKVKLTFPCCLASAAPITIICVVINGGYRTGSEVDSLWVQASVAEGSALPWKIEHLGASWRTSLPCCATTTQVPTGAMPPPARSHWTKAGQMVPLPTNEQPLRTAHCPLPLPYHSTQGWVWSPDNLR